MNNTEKNAMILQIVARTTVKSAEQQQVREATTGASVLPRLYAVGTEHSLPAETRPLELVGTGSKVQVRPRPELAFYRKYTEAMLRRYLRVSMESGRVPSLLGRELFRARVTSYKMQSFEDAVIFCFDMERCLAKLNEEEREVIKRVGLQEYSHGEAAAAMGISLRSVVQKYGKALDRLTGILLAARLLEPQTRLPGE
ncbi:MAG: sigma factor-like helix-turn-helix DNA-binding protein [Acidobacteriaceae bacterium]|nr:sigma factor-like helix-turn-helix DNA-binding protein [Acidobacteriaceae bacterium]